MGSKIITFLNKDLKPKHKLLLEKKKKRTKFIKHQATILIKTKFNSDLISTKSTRSYETNKGEGGLWTKHKILLNTLLNSPSSLIRLRKKKCV